MRELIHDLPFTFVRLAERDQKIERQVFPCGRGITVVPIPGHSLLATQREFAAVLYFRRGQKRGP